MKLRTASLASLALLVAACGDEPAEPAGADGERSAEGDVLGGTISDEMLPLDTVRSQSPSLKEAGEDGEGEGGEGSASQPASQPQAEAESEPEETAEPAAEAPAEEAEE